jgi:hypothetical protein
MTGDGASAHAVAKRGEDLRRELGVFRRAVLNGKDFGDIALADYGCLHREQLVR